MTYNPGWPPPPPPTPPPEPPRRYSTPWIWLGVVLGIATTMGLPLLGLIVVSRFNELDAVGGVLFLIGLVVPLVVGIIFAARQGPPERRGLGLGLIIGWAVAPIVFAGACILIVLGAYQWSA